MDFKKLTDQQLLDERGVFIDCHQGGKNGVRLAPYGYFVRGCIKVDDTLPGIEEGRNAGMWCVGISLAGNEVGLTQEALDRPSRSIHSDGVLKNACAQRARTSS